MSLNWKLQPRFANRPHNLMRFLAISLLLHGVVFLGLETYLRMNGNHPFRTEPDALLPVKFIEVPADKLVKPPSDAKLKASSNSRAGGEARPELPLAVGSSSARPTTPSPSSHPSLTQSNSSTPQPSRDALPPQQPQLAPRQDTLPQTSDNSDDNPSEAQTSSQQEAYSKQPSLPQDASLLGGPVHLPNREPTRARIHRSNANRQAVNGNPNNNLSEAQAWAQMRASARQLQRQSASLLGGPVIATNEFTGNSRGQLSNSNRLAPGSPGVDASQEVDLGPYLDRLRQQVKQQWHPVLSHSSAHTIIGFAISRTGEVSDLRILKPSGSTLTDQAELQAIQRAAPFGPLPDGYRPTALSIQFNFNQIQY